MLAAIIFGEPQAERALALLGDDELAVPSLLDYELASIARTKTRREPEKRTILREALRIGLRYAARRANVDFPAVLELALATGLSTYDASYLWLARELGAELVTFDQHLAEAARAT